MGALARAIGDPDGPELLDWLGDYIGALSAKGGTFNLSLAYSVGSSALTIAAKQQGGSNATTDQPIIAGMRSATATSGDYNVRSIEAALSLVVSSGSTLGQSNSDTRWTYVYLIEDGSSNLELAVSSKFFGLQGIVSTTAEGGAGAADSATVMYSTTARSNTPFLCVGRFKGPQTVAGTWAAVPTSAEMQPFVPGQVLSDDGSVSTPSQAFELDTDTGRYRIGADNMADAVGGTKIVDYQSTGIAVGGSSIGPAGANTAGVGIGTTGTLNACRDGDVALTIGRKTNDGNLAEWVQDGTTEGAVAVAGTTVTYGSFCGAHDTQLADGARPEILRGTVLSTIDAMCDWLAERWQAWVPATDRPPVEGQAPQIDVPAHFEERVGPYDGDLQPGQSYTHADGTVRTVEREDNDQLPRAKVSDVAADKAVYGVFVCWDGDWTASNDLRVASLGAFLVRMQAGQTPQRGDFVESAGDGTARVQVDDILRASTVGKITSTTVIETFGDGSFLVPCTLHCG